MPKEIKVTTVQEFRDTHTGALWLAELTDREIEEILLALLYVEHFNHGTSGHLVYTVLAKLAKALLSQL